MNIPTTTTSTTRIAVFIDFDNVEIGVKNTIGGQFTRVIPNEIENPQPLAGNT